MADLRHHHRHDLFPAVTLSFNLAPGVALGDAVNAIAATERQANLPTTVSGSFQGAAQVFQESLSSEPLLILAAIVTIYLVLGALYESAIYPLTIISTLPSAGLGALIALIVCSRDLSIMGMIGVPLLIGIVKKNAIMMIDFALVTPNRVATSTSVMSGQANTRSRKSCPYACPRRHAIPASDRSRSPLEFIETCAREA